MTVSISGGRDVSVGGDVVGRDRVGGDVVAGDQIVGVPPSFRELYADTIARYPVLGQAVDTQVRVVEEELAEKEPDVSRLERAINELGDLVPDVFEVALATLVDPLAGLRLVVRKIRAKAVALEQRG